MSPERVNQASTLGLIVLSLIALMTVLPSALRAVISGQMPVMQADEHAGAHIFQLSIAALLPIGILFLVTVNWDAPWRIAGRLAFPAVTGIVAFGILYYFEHAQ